MRLTSVPILMRKPFWWWQCTPRYSVLHPPPTHNLWGSRSLPVPLQSHLPLSKSNNMNLKTDNPAFHFKGHVQVVSFPWLWVARFNSLIHHTTIILQIEVIMRKKGIHCFHWSKVWVEVLEKSGSKFDLKMLKFFFAFLLLSIWVNRHKIHVIRKIRISSFECLPLSKSNNTGFETDNPAFLCRGQVLVVFFLLMQSYTLCTQWIQLRMIAKVSPRESYSSVMWWHVLCVY